MVTSKNLLVLFILIKWQVFLSGNQSFSMLPLCTRKFSQTDLGFGNLRRYFGSHGELLFPSDMPDKVRYPEVEMFLRLHPDSRSTRADHDIFSVPSATTLSLAMTLDKLHQIQRQKLMLNIFLSGIENDFIINWLGWVDHLFHNRTKYQVYICPSGNVPSYDCMMSILWNKSNLSSPESIYYLLEDDYLHQSTSTMELLDIFVSHNPCFALPYDYADRYRPLSPLANPDDGKITIIAGKDRHWRTVSSMTVTYAARVETLIHFKDILPHPKNDFYNSLEIYKRNGTILSPLPSLSSHTESFNGFGDLVEEVSIYFDWFHFGQNLTNLVKLNPNSLYFSFLRESVESL